jgi:nucleolar protein 56
MVDYLLSELPVGYLLAKHAGGGALAETDMQDYAKFSKIITLEAFLPFHNAQHALENSLAISEGILHASLAAFLSVSISTGVLGVADPTLGGNIHTELKIECSVADNVKELLRGIRLHSHRLLSQLAEGDLSRAQLGLGHAYSRSKVKLNVNRVDNMITQSICLLDQLDKDVNTFGMRVREWYGWHFPELIKIVTENSHYAFLVKIIRNKGDLTEDHLEGKIKSETRN